MTGTGVSAAGRTESLATRYRDSIAEYVEDTPTTEPLASVVVVTYHTDRREFETMIKGLGEQTAKEFELVVVDNGNDWSVQPAVSDLDRPTVFARLRRNYGVTFGRNLGARLAGAPLIIFLDDDGIPEPDFVEAHLRAHEDPVLGVRGRIIPRTDDFYNRRQSWYDLGDKPVPHYLNIEGNCSYDRETFLSVGGFEEDLEGRAGHEGIDLTYRLIEEAGYGRERFIYHPDPVIHHDIASGPLSYIKKRIEREHNHQRLSEWRSELSEFTDRYGESEAAKANRARRRDMFIRPMFTLSVWAGCLTRRIRDRVSPFGGGS